MDATRISNPILVVIGRAVDISTLHVANLQVCVANPTSKFEAMIGILEASDEQHLPVQVKSIILDSDMVTSRGSLIKFI